MAQIGLKLLRYSPLGEDGKYTGVKILGKAISAKVNPIYAEAKLYADDMIAEEVSICTGGEVEFVVDDMTPETYAEVYGYKYDETEKKIERKVTDISIFVGVGRIITKMVNGKYQYVVEFLKKVKFKDALPEEKTKGESIEFGTPTLAGSFFILADNTWSIKRYFDAEEEAITFLDSLMKIETEETIEEEGE